MTATADSVEDGFMPVTLSFRRSQLIELDREVQRTGAPRSVILRRILAAHQSQEVCPVCGGLLT